jgi:hypothetical protein
MIQSRRLSKSRSNHGGIFLPLLVVSALLLGAVSAMAEAVRLPKTGDPAFAFDVPNGWTTLYDQYGNLRITATERTCFIQLSMITGPDVERPMPEVAAEIIKSAGAAPYSKTEAGAIAGQAGTKYLTTLTNSNGVRLDFKLVLVKLDSAHYASLAILMVPDVSPDRAAALDVLIGRIRLTGLN